MSGMGSRWNGASLFIRDIRLPAAFHLTEVFILVVEERDRNCERINEDGASQGKMGESSPW